jgi:hypothetical protein
VAVPARLPEALALSTVGWHAQHQFIAADQLILGEPFVLDVLAELRRAVPRLADP